VFALNQGGPPWKPLIQSLDFVAVPSTDAARTRAFYVDTLGLRADERAKFEFWVGETCFTIWEPASMGMPFVPQTSGSLALHVGGRPGRKGRTRGEGHPFVGDTIDTGVCRMALFADPDGNGLMLHHRYAPYA